MPEDLDSILGAAPKQNAYSPSLAYPQSASTISASSGVSKQIAALLKRYRDAYLYARVVVGVGKFIKVVGILLAILLVLAAFIAGSVARSDPLVSLILGAILGGIVWVVFYIWGVLVSAVGQILKASLDSAVNNSPFLTNEHRAKIMSLPEA